MLNLSESAVVMTLKTRGGDYGIQVRRNQVELHPGFSPLENRDERRSNLFSLFSYLRTIFSSERLVLLGSIKKL
jgi:hypothetical protein